jgi:hypothetical protein
VLFQERDDFPHALDWLAGVVFEPSDGVPWPFARLKGWNREIMVEPDIRFLQPGDLKLIETSLVTKNSRFRYKTRKRAMVLVIIANNKPNEHFLTPRFLTPSGSLLSTGHVNQPPAAQEFKGRQGRRASDHDLQPDAHHDVRVSGTALGVLGYSDWSTTETIVCN